MENYLYDVYKSYYNARSKLGYLSFRKLEPVLILTFIFREFIQRTEFPLEEEKYDIIAKALKCLNGKTCLMPYQNYLLMKKTTIKKPLSMLSELSRITYNFDERLRAIEKTKVIKSNKDVREVEDIQL